MLLRGEVQAPPNSPLCAVSDSAHPLSLINGTSHNDSEMERENESVHVGMHIADHIPDAIVSHKDEQSQAGTMHRNEKNNTFSSPERAAKNSNTREKEDEVEERSAYETINVSNAHSNSSGMQQDKVRHWLEMERGRLVGTTIRSGEMMYSSVRPNRCHHCLHKI